MDGKGRDMTLMTNPAHPGEVLSELYLQPLDMSAITLAKRLHVPRTRIERLVKGDTALTVDTAVRLATFFRTTPEYWMNLQRAWDLARARETIDVSGITPFEAA
jgi:addiction module HigA family antidote